MRSRAVNDVVVVVHSKNAPDTTSWRQFIETIERTCEQHGTARLLVWTPGPAPNAIQRADVVNLANTHPLPIAVCTESRLARGAIQALSWASRVNIKAFKDADLSGACEHLGVPPHRAATLGKILETLQEELSGGSGTFPTTSRQ